MDEHDVLTIYERTADDVYRYASRLTGGNASACADLVDDLVRQVRAGRSQPVDIGWAITTCWDRDRDRVHTSVWSTLCCMNVDRFSVTMSPELGAAVREAAGRSGASVSSWLSAAAAERLRHDLLGAALDVWEAEDGPFGDGELRRAAAALKLRADRVIA